MCFLGHMGLRDGAAAINNSLTFAFPTVVEGIRGMGEKRNKCNSFMITTQGLPASSAVYMFPFGV